MLMADDIEQLALFANEAFYLAFESKDVNAMGHLWSSTKPVACLHPGWPALHGRELVLNSWKDILGNPGQGQVSFFDATCARVAQDTVVVTCYEDAGGSIMIATNVFVQESAGLKLVLHQAGFCAHPPQQPD